MLALMQERPLAISALIEFAALHHGATEIVSRRVEGDVHRYTWADSARRARQVAQALDGENLDRGERIGTLAWNGYRHLELYFGVSGSGRVLHTINPRLHPDQIAWIVQHAQDRIVAFDVSFLPLVLAIRDQCPGVRTWLALCGDDGAQTPEFPAGVERYETWIAAHDGAYRWPSLDENSASSMCYTSGTTGNPKGALYSHRSTVLHAMTMVFPDSLGLSARDALLPVVPLFHVNAWGLPYAAAMVGCKLVLPGPALDGPSIHALMEQEGVTVAAGVPTVWQMLLSHLQSSGQRFSTLNRTAIGGSACPPAMLRSFRDHYGVEVIQAWGMTEMSPLGTACTLKAKHRHLDADAQAQVLCKQGRAVFGVDLRIADDEGRDLPWDGVAAGELMVRGPWIIRDYFEHPGPAPLVKDPEGNDWFPTGDIATIDPDGYMQITDRSKDLIKSGGEWISSIDLENIAMAHPDVAMAACIGIRHPKWDERPILVVARRSGSTLEREELLAFYQGKAARWQIPDDVVFVDDVPMGATGKVLKTRVRELLRDYRLPATTPQR